MTRKDKVVMSILITLVLFGIGVLIHYAKPLHKPGAGRMVPELSIPTCDPSLWQHVYHGKFKTAEDRLKPLGCKTVSGVLHFVRREKDGDLHLRLDVDPQFKYLLNAENAREQNMLVVEFICVQKPTQHSTVAEHVCDGFDQEIYRRVFRNKYVEITGEWVTDEEHGWNELHPVTSIKLY
jgi:hypothetical protein